MLGGRINFSGRTVIVPNAKLKAYEVEIPYVSFVEMFSEQIVNIIKKMEGCTYGEALQQWFNGYIQYDDKIYKIINHMLKKSKHKCRILLNRNPTINFGSFTTMEIASVKKDYNDLSCGLPIACLQSLNADLTSRSA